MNAHAFIMTDDFNDGVTDGWWLTAPSYPDYSYGTGNWRIQNQMMTEDDARGDQFKALVTGHQFTSQYVETRLLLNGGGTNGYGGVTLWYQDVNSWIDVIAYPVIHSIGIIEVATGLPKQTVYYDYNVNLSEGSWHFLKVVADSQNGSLAIYLDNNFILQYGSMRSGLYSGLSGLNAGNGGGFFDDFRVSGDINPVPLPSAAWLFGSGLVMVWGRIAWHRRRKINRSF